MTTWWRNTRIPLAAEAALAVAASLGFFGLVAAVLGITTRPIPVLVLAAFCGVIIFNAAHAGADIYAVPLALAAVLAFDFFYLPPLRSFGFPDYANWGALSLYLGVAVLVCTISARTRRRVEALATAEGALADEQAALRRVATLVAREASPTDVLSAVAEEVGRLIGIESTRVLRYEADNTATVISGWNLEGPLPIGDHLSLEGTSVAAMVFHTRQPARLDSYAEATGSISAAVRAAGIWSSVGCPITVGGQLWGAMVAVTTQREPMPAGTEFRLAEFTELVATAISNAESRAELTASRARLVSSADATRQRIERELHDGIQQRLVSLALQLQGADALLPAEFTDVHAELSRLGTGLAAVLDEVRAISRGIHPAILSEGGLQPALRALGRRSPVPVMIEVRTTERLPEPIEVAAYYCVSEALTNAAKHAQASAVHVNIEAASGKLRLSIRDDGIGGADLAGGSGLIGLVDRVEALGGKFHLSSPLGNGTWLIATLPIDADPTP